MLILENIRLAFRRPVSPLSNEQLEALEAQIDRDIVARFSSGNIRLQQGRYVTRRDLDKKYQRIKDLKFSNAA